MQNYLRIFDKDTRNHFLWRESGLTSIDNCRGCSWILERSLERVEFAFWFDFIWYFITEYYCEWLMRKFVFSLFVYFHLEFIWMKETSLKLDSQSVMRGFMKNIWARRNSCSFTKFKIIFILHRTMYEYWKIFQRFFCINMEFNHDNHFSCLIQTCRLQVEAAMKIQKCYRWVPVDNRKVWIIKRQEEESLFFCIWAGTSSSTFKIFNLASMSNNQDSRKYAHNRYSSWINYYNNFRIENVKAKKNSW